MHTPDTELSKTEGGAADRLSLVLGDQLDSKSVVLRDLDPRRDVVLMMEVSEEATHVPSNPQRTVLFLSAMRHFAKQLNDKGIRVRYIRLDDPDNTNHFTGEVGRAIKTLSPHVLRLVRPGEHRVFKEVREWERRFKMPVEILEDSHFLTDIDDFESWMADRRRPMMDHFYREQRRRLGILVEQDGKPHGGSWSLDAENRKAFRAKPSPPPLPKFKADRTTRGVADLVRHSFPNAAGTVDSFNWPVTRRQAMRALSDFVSHRLPLFGTYQDAMWTGEPFLYHSLLSHALNLKLLDPREVVDAALQAFDEGKAPLNAVEGFVRQVIGWREFIRGIYWTEGPDYANRNTLEAHGRLPEFYWTGDTEMACMQESIGQVLRFGYGHHIQRLMVTGNFALISGVHPRTISDWYLGMYVDAVDWVTLPNTLGMVMHADGGVVGTKPYAASGRYIDRMSNYCGGCPYDPKKRTGSRACPFTTFYWDFLLRNKHRFGKHPRMTMMMRNADRIASGERKQITAQADRLREAFHV